VPKKERNPKKGGGEGTCVGEKTNSTGRGAQFARGLVKNSAKHSRDRRGGFKKKGLDSFPELMRILLRERIAKAHKEGKI